MDSNNRKIEILHSVFGEYSGNYPQIIFYCPKCNHRKKKLSINIEEEIFQCWVCKFHGILFHLLREYCNNQNLIDEFKKLSNNKYDNIKLDDATFLEYIQSKLFNIETEKDQPKKQLKWSKDFTKITNDSISPHCKNAVRFLKKRGITFPLINKYNINYCDTGNYAQHVIIPSYDKNGYLNYYVGRSIIENEIKYKNPKIEKESIIFNELFISWKNEICLVEGPFDAIKNDINAIPILGSSLTENNVLFKKIVENKCIVNLVFDNDKAGRYALIKSGQLLMQWGIETYYTELKPFNDPAEMNYENIQIAIMNKKTLTDYTIINKLLE